MNKKAFLFTTLGVFIFTFCFEYIWHGHALMSLYEKTPQVWRTEEQMMSLFPFMVVRQLILSAIISFIFTQNYEGRGLLEGLRFGCLLGLLLGVLEGGSYGYLPISLTLAMLWFLGQFIFGLGVGIICALLYRFRKVV